MTNALMTVNRDDWQIMTEQAAMLVQTGFLPTAIKTKEQAVAVMLKGRELGIPPMHALSSIVVIQGKPTANAELMLALIYRDHGDDAVMFTESSATVCTISYKRRSWPQRQAYTFTFEDAKRAGVTGNQNWSKYPAAMLRARCISAVARMAFPDTIGGMYTPEELGAHVTVNQSDEVVVIDGTLPEEPIRGVVEVLTAEAAEPTQRDLILEALDELSDPRDLAGIRDWIRNAELDGDEEVALEYKRTYKRLHGSGTPKPANEQQPPLV